jgi:hypothetical protein
VAAGQEARAGGGVVEGAKAAKYWEVSEITSTDQISAITSTELVHNEVDDRATMSQKSSLPNATRFVSGALPPDTAVAS